jgi:Cdc6-like AAA superfamily ATPase
MTNDVWLPKGYVLPDGAKIRSLLHSGDNWQIFATSGSSNILLTSPQLAERWDTLGFLDAAVFGHVSFGSEVFWSITSNQKYLLEPVASGKPPESTVDALAFSLALKESRKQSAETSFHDALYIEMYARLLPTWTLTPAVDDELVLGAWLTGGVEIPTTSFRRLTHLTGWMPAGELAKIVTAAGLSVPADAGLLARSSPVSRTPIDRTVAAPKVAETEQESSSKKSASPEEFRLPGRPQLEFFFNEHVIDIIYNSEKYQALGIDFPSAVVLHGPPGCGKTFAVDRLVEFIDWPVYSINSNTVGSPYIHATSKKISEIFDQAIENAPSVVVIDEMESFLADRALGSSSSMHRVEEVAEFLRRIPEAIEKRVLIIAMTNLIEMIDPAILRRGRFDHIIQVGMPSREEVASLVDSLLSRLPKTDQLDLESLIDQLSGKALSDAAFVIRESARLAAKSGKTQIDQDSLEMALASLPREQLTENKRSIGFVRNK